MSLAAFVPGLLRSLGTRQEGPILTTPRMLFDSQVSTSHPNSRTISSTHSVLLPGSMQAPEMTGLRGRRRALLERAVRVARVVAVRRDFDRRGLFGVLHAGGVFGVLGLEGRWSARSSSGGGRV